MRYYTLKIGDEEFKAVRNAYAKRIWDGHEAFIDAYNSPSNRKQMIWSHLCAVLSNTGWRWIHVANHNCFFFTVGSEKLGYKRYDTPSTIYLVAPTGVGYEVISRREVEQ